MRLSQRFGFKEIETEHGKPQEATENVVLLCTKPSYIESDCVSDVSGSLLSATIESNHLSSRP